MAILAARPELTPVKVGVTVGALGTGPVEFQVRVTLPALHLAVPAP